MAATAIAPKERLLAMPTGVLKGKKSGGGERHGEGRRVDRSGTFAQPKVAVNCRKNPEVGAFSGKPALVQAGWHPVFRPRIQKCGKTRHSVPRIGPALPRKGSVR
jgi:hypothetical protein